MKSIQTKFLAIVISSILLLAFVITLISMIFMRNTLNTDSDVITKSVSDTEALRINSYLRDIEHLTTNMENYMELTLQDNLDLLNTKEKREAYEKNVSEAFYSPMNSHEGIVAYYLRFDAAQVGGNEYSGFYQGKLSIAQAEFESAEPENLPGWVTEEWFSIPKEQGKATWLSPYYCHSKSGLQIISYVIPIYIESKFIGVAGVDIEFSTVTDMVSDISVYDNGFAYLSSSAGDLIFSPVDHELLDRATHHKHGFAEEHKQLDNGMTLVIHADYSDIQSDSYRMTMIIVGIVALFLIGFIIGTYIITKRIVRPLKDLTSAAELLADGKTDLHIGRCKTNDEVGVLAMAFEKTAEKLGGYMSYINALAYKDSLTGVKNRTAYNEIVTEIDVSIELNDCEPFAILVADINGLKKTNDRYGHEIGNRLIVRSAKVICDVFKHSPVYRIGGDEFAVVMRGEDYDRHEALIIELDEKCSAATVAAGEETIQVSIARAAAVYESEKDSSFDDVFNRADKKMYEHKESMK